MIIAQKPLSHSMRKDSKTFTYALSVVSALAVVVIIGLGIAVRSDLSQASAKETDATSGEPSPGIGQPATPDPVIAQPTPAPPNPILPDHDSSEFDINDFDSIKRWAEQYTLEYQRIQDNTLVQSNLAQNNALVQSNLVENNELAQSNLVEKWEQYSNPAIGQTVKWDFKVDLITHDCVAVGSRWPDSSIHQFLQVRFERVRPLTYGANLMSLGVAWEALAIDQHISYDSALKLRKNDKISVQGVLQSVELRNGYVMITLSNAHAADFSPKQA